jgi:hypothetical protein
MEHEYLPHLELMVIDRRTEIATYERQFRPFPPRSGSVSKPKPSLEPLPEWGDFRVAFAEPGAGRPLPMYVGIDVGMEPARAVVVYDHADPWEVPG